VKKFIYPPQADKPKLFIIHNIQAGHSIFAHSRSDKIGTPRLLPTSLISPLGKGGYEGGSMEYQQKNPLRYYALPFLSKFVNKVH